MSETPAAQTGSRDAPSMFLSQSEPKDGVRAARGALIMPQPVVAQPLGTPWLVLLAFIVSMGIGWLTFSGTAAKWLAPAPNAELPSDLRRLPAD